MIPFSSQTCIYELGNESYHGVLPVRMVGIFDESQSYGVEDIHIPWQEFMDILCLKNKMIGTRS